MKKQDIWRRVNRDDNPEQYTVMDGFTELFLRELPRLVRAENRQELIIKLETMLLQTTGGHQRFRAQIMKEIDQIKGIDAIKFADDIDSAKKDILETFKPYIQIPKASPSYNQIALIHYYENEPIGKKNCQQIANEHGLKSGEYLRQRYSYYTGKQNRRGDPVEDTKKSLKCKFVEIERVLPYLSEKPKGQAIDELKIIKSYIQ